MNGLPKSVESKRDFSKLLEGVLKDWMIEDIGDKFDIGQFGGQGGIGTEHMLVCLVDRVLFLLDRFPDKSAVIAASVDWSAAFDHQDSTLAIKRFIEIGVRPRIIPVIYLEGK